MAAKSDVSCRSGAEKQFERMKWDSNLVAKETPFRTKNIDCVVASGDMVYIMLDNHEVYAYDYKNLTWSQLPKCPFSACSLAVINDLLTTIGGVKPDQEELEPEAITNKLLSLKMSEESCEACAGMSWTEVFPHLPTKRYLSIAICDKENLVVAGGRGFKISRGDIVGRLSGGLLLTKHKYMKTFKTVEVMNISTQQWSTVCKLPIPMDRKSSLGTVFGGHIKFYSTCSPSLEESLYLYYTYSCSLSALIQSGQPSISLGARLKRGISPSRQASIWEIEKTVELPIASSTLVQTDNCLLAIGGCEFEVVSGVNVGFLETVSTRVHMYDPTNNTWKLIGNLAMNRKKCLAVALSNNSVIVVGGGVNRHDHATDTVEIGVLA